MSMPLQTIFRLRALHYRAVAKREAKKTKTQKAVAKHEGAVTALVSKVLTAQAKKIALLMSHRYAHYMKAIPSWAEDLVDEVDTDGVGIAIREAISANIQSVFKQAGLTALAEVDQDATGEMLQHMDEEALRWATSRGSELVTSISETTRDELRDLTESAIEEGLSPGAFASSIEDSLAFGEERSSMIARTELAFSHVQGNLAGYKASGVVERKRWLADDEACEICQGLDGEEVALDESFDADGEDVDGPPAHPNCRCDVIPVTSTEEE